MPSLGKAWVNITANLSPLKKGLAMARSVTATAMKAISFSVIKPMQMIASAIRSAFDTVVKWTKRAMVSVAVAVGLATKAASSYEKQLAMVSTMVTTNVGPTMARFRKQLQETSMDFGEGTETLAGGLYDILSASIPAAKAMDVLRVAVKAAQGGMTDTKTAADAITTILNSYQLQAESATDVSDKLFSTVLRGKITFEQLAGSIGRVAATASIAGMSLDELLALVATLTRQGINSNEAVTAISGTLRAFLKPADDAVETAKQFGLELSSNTLKSKGFIGAVMALEKASAEQLATIIPNIRAFKALAAALKDTAGFQYDLNLITNKYSGQSEDARKKTDTFGRELGKTWQTLKAVFVEFGAPLLEPFKEALVLVQMELRNVLKFVQANADTIQDWGNKGVQALIPIVNYMEKLWVIGKVHGWGRAVDTVLQDVGAGIRMLYDKAMEQIPKLAPLFQRVFDEIKPGIIAIGKDTIWPILQDLYSKLKDEWKTHREAIKNALIGAFEDITPYAIRLGEYIGDGLLSALKAAGKAIGGKALDVAPRLGVGAIKGLGGLISGSTAGSYGREIGGMYGEAARGFNTQNVETMALAQELAKNRQAVEANTRAYKSGDTVY